jgi:hypothetical protein
MHRVKQCQLCYVNDDKTPNNSRQCQLAVPLDSSMLNMLPCGCQVNHGREHLASGHMITGRGSQQHQLKKGAYYVVKAE